MNTHGGPTPQDYHEFGEELVDFAQRAAKPVVDGRVAGLERQISELQADAVKQRVTSALDADPALAGKWRALNTDPAFLAWANQVHEFAGRPRLELMREAFAHGDAQRVGQFFKAFLAHQIPVRQRTPERLPLEAPPKATIRSADLAPQRVWTRAEISRFYRDVAAGRYDGHEAEKLRIEHEIVAAANERRVLQPPTQIDVK